MIDFSFSVICFLLILLNSINLLQGVVEIDLVLCFNILHNLLIYSGNFYRNNSEEYTFIDYVDKFLYTSLFLLSSDVILRITLEIKKFLLSTEKAKVGD